MPHFRYLRLFAGLLLLSLFSGCIGTDLVDELIGPDLSKVEIDRESASLFVNGTLQLSATYYDYNGQSAQSTFQWQSKNEAVARVSTSGLVTAIGVGQTHILALASQGKRDSVLVTVVADPNSVASVKVIGAKNSLAINEKLQLTAEVRNASGGLINGKTISWKSSSPNVAMISATGEVTAFSSGKTSITATADGIASTPFDIEVGGGARSGTFIGRSGYTASGTATILRDSTGALIVRLESDFRTSTGPGLFVYLGKSSSSGTNGAELGALKSTSGLQTYPIPAAVNPNDFSHVLIYCKPFNVVFAYAELK